MQKLDKIVFKTIIIIAKICSYDFLPPQQKESVGN